MAERGTGKFYGEQAERLRRMAGEALGLTLRLELREMARSFQILADRQAMLERTAPKTKIA